MRLQWAIALVCVGLIAGRARAESWSSVFAAETDSGVFLAADGTLFRSPFNLNTRDTLWRAREDQHVVRFAVSPGSGRVAWIVRGFDDDTTRLWFASEYGVEQRLRYFALQPRNYSQRLFEPDVPTRSDRGARGVRLTQGGMRSLRHAANTLAWTSEGDNVLLGYDGGIARIAPDGGSGVGIAGVLAVGLEVLQPSQWFLVDAVNVEPESTRSAITQFDIAHLANVPITVSEGRIVPTPARGQRLLSPGSNGWRECPATEWIKARVRCVSRSALWWASAGSIYALRSMDCTARRELESASDIRWLGFDEAHGELLVVSGRSLWRRPDAGGAPTRVLDVFSDIHAVLQSRTGASIALVTRDSLIVLDPESGVVQRFRATGLETCAWFESPDGAIVAQVECDAGPPRRLARTDAECGCLVPIDTPVERSAVFESVANGAWILCFVPGRNPPRRIQAYDVSNRRWHSVDNPGIRAWEPMR